VAKNEPQRVKKIMPFVKSSRFYQHGIVFDLIGERDYLDKTHLSLQHEKAFILNKKNGLSGHSLCSDNPLSFIF
jgi:hypothetical protein